MLGFLFILSLLAMSDFPPNLEDGEQWLPSDIYEEISSIFRVKPKVEVNNITQDLAIKIKSFDQGGNNVVQVNYGKPKGTGVFIPQINGPNYIPKFGERKGTGVYIPSMVIDTLVGKPTNQMSGKKKKVNKGAHVHPAKKLPIEPSKIHGFQNTIYPYL